MAVAAVASSSGLPLPRASDQTLADSRSSSSSGSVNSCGEGVSTFFGSANEQSFLEQARLIMENSYLRTVCTAESFSYPVCSLKKPPYNPSERSKLEHVNYEIFTISREHLSNLKAGVIKTVRLNPLFHNNPDCSSEGAAITTIKDKRVFIVLTDASGTRNMYRAIFQLALIHSEIATISEVIITTRFSKDLVLSCQEKFTSLGKGNGVRKLFVAGFSIEKYSKPNFEVYKALDVFSCAYLQLTSNSLFNASMNSAQKANKVAEIGNKELEGVNDHRKQQAEEDARALAGVSLMNAQMQSRATGHYVAPAIPLPAARQAAYAHYGVQDDNSNGCSVQ